MQSPLGIPDKDQKKTNPGHIPMKIQKWTSQIRF